MMVPAILGTINIYLYTIVSSMVILLVGFAAGFLARKFLHRILQEVEFNRILLSVGLTMDAERWLSLLVSALIYLSTIIFFLDHLGLRSIVIYLLFGAVLLLLLLTILAGCKDVIPNFLGWWYLRRNRSIQKGRKVEIQEIAGVIERVGYLETEVRTKNGDLLYIPNALFRKSRRRAQR